MQIILTNHARQRMQERKIHKIEIDHAIHNPDRSGSQGSKKYVMKTRKNKHLLIVYYTETLHIIKVTTVITTSKTHKYIKP